MGLQESKEVVKFPPSPLSPHKWHTGRTFGRETHWGFLLSFLFFCYCWCPAFTCGGPRGCRGLFQFSCIYWDLLCDQVCGQFWVKFHNLQRRRYILLGLCERLCKYVWSIWLITAVSSCCFCFVFVWMPCLLVRVGYWSLSLSLCEGQYVIYAVIVFLLWTWVPLCLVHRCLDLQCLLLGFSFDEHLNVLPYLFWFVWFEVCFVR